MAECLGSLNHNICEIFLDDVIIFAATYEEHLSRIHQVFQKFREYNLKLSPKKCNFFRDRVRYVGHISAEGIAADPDKIDQIMNWPEPQNVGELRAYLGFASYYRKFVRNFSKIAKPLNDLLGGKITKTKRKGKSKLTTNTDDMAKWKWGEPERQAFEELKLHLTTPPVLAYPDFTRPFIVHTDASSCGLGAVLYKNNGGKENVIAYASRGLSRTERNYSVHKL